MTEISVAAVKSLRDRTGAGMMDCKRALQETDGDEERAIDLLRKKGAAKAARRAGREAEEGTVQVAPSPEDAGPVAMVEVTSETDFVARNDEFVAFAQRAAVVARDGDLPEGEVGAGEDLLDLPADDPLREELNELRAKIGENLRMGRWIRYEPADDALVGEYVHFGNTIGVLVEIGGVENREQAESLAREIAMHVAAADPVGVSPDDIPAEERQREEKLLREQAEEEGKPPEIVEKIVEGRMRKFYEENALLRQGFVKDPDTTVGELIRGVDGDLEVRRFVRFEVGS